MIYCFRLTGEVLRTARLNGPILWYTVFNKSLARLSKGEVIKELSKFLSALAVLIILNYPSTSTATTWYITSDGLGTVPTIQAGIDLADTGDIVELADGTFTGEGNRDLDFLGKAITVRSASGNPEACVIDCESGPDSHRGFIFQSGEGHDSILEGVTVSNGHNNSVGSGIYCNYASPTIRNVIFKDNWGSYFGGGAGLACIGSNLKVIDCVFLENRTTNGYVNVSGGGGAFCYESIPTFSGCIFSGNFVDSNFDSGGVGGGLALALSEAMIINCSFINNYIEPSNMGIARGAGLYANNSTAVIEFCTFSGNTSDMGAGGAVATYGDCNVVLNNCTMYGNEAFEGTVQLHGGEVEINNTIIANNLLSEWTMSQEPGAVVVWEGLVTLNCSDIYDNESGDWEGAIADQFAINGNISEDPLFCDVENGDFSIRSDSPCSPEFTPACGLIGALDVGCEAPSGVSYGTNPAAFRLGQACPNPFNPQTTISFFINHPQHVSVEVFDIKGRRIAELTNQKYQVGEHSVEWQGRDSEGRAVPSGEYFFRVEYGDQVETRKAMLLR